MGAQTEPKNYRAREAGVAAVPLPLRGLHCGGQGGLLGSPGTRQQSGALALRTPLGSALREHACPGLPGGPRLPADSLVWRSTSLLTTAVVRNFWGALWLLHGFIYRGRWAGAAAASPLHSWLRLWEWDPAVVWGAREESGADGGLGDPGVLREGSAGILGNGVRQGQWLSGGAGLHWR